MIRTNWKYFVLGLVAVSAVSCDKGFEELNVNPNAPTIANPDQLFTEALIINAGQFNTAVNTEQWSLQVWTQMMADINGINVGSGYNYDGGWNDQLWAEWYTRVLSPCSQIIRLTEDDPFLVNKTAIARILRAYAFQRITDLWGDVPYTDALLGFNPDGSPIRAPRYDSQQTVYMGLLAELKEAVAAIDPTKDSFFGADVLYSGDFDAWIKFGNSIRLRMAMRLSEVDPATAQQHVSELLADESTLISSVSEGAHFEFNAEERNPFFELFNSGQGLRNPSHFLIEFLRENNDPRLPIYAQETPSSQVAGTEPFVGVPNQLTLIELNSLGINTFNSSLVGDHFLNITIRGTSMSYAEVCFLKAEAALRGWGGSMSAGDYYNAGVTASMEWVNTPNDSITSFLAGAGAFDGTLENIIEQKWLDCVYTNAYEGFAEWRRTGFPILTDENDNPINTSAVPKRLPYPPSEWVTNGTNVAAVGLSNNDKSTPVWWDK